MEVAGLLIGLPGLIQTCVHGYRFVCTMSDLDKNVIVLRLRYRIEESRLVLWGRFWGLLTPCDDQQVQTPPQNLDDLLEIPGIQGLITDILNQVMKLLQDVRKMSEKYSGSQSQPRPSPDATDDGKNQNNLTKHSRSAKVKWALKDKSTFESILESLTSLNDGLEKLLPRPERVRLGQALVGEVLAEEGIKPGGKDSDNLAAAFDRTSTDSQPTVRRKQESQAQMIHRSDISRDVDAGLSGSGSYKDVSDPESENGQHEEEPTTTMKLNLEWFINMAGKKDGFSMETVRLPVGFKPGMQNADASLLTLNDQPHEGDSDISPGRAAEWEGNDAADMFVEESVFVEWRSYDESAADEQLQMALDARREQVSRLFQKDCKEGTVYVMQCLGFVLPDKMTMGLVFRPPPNFAGPPVSLNAIMRDNFESASAVVPDLEDRIRLAKNLSTALYQLQCSGWLHRNVSSHNVVFFPVTTEHGVKVDYSQPKVIGWQTARYDDQIYFQTSEYSSVWRKNKWAPQELPYIHPSRPAARIRFKRSFDVYSLGIVLAEIAFWEPIDVLNGEGQSELFPNFDQSSHAVQLQNFSELVISTCKAELAGEVGGRYKSAVLWALEGVKSWQALQAIDHRGATKGELEKEIGLEKAFFWNVLNQLDFVPER
jgi:hypothetical protein